MKVKKLFELAKPYLERNDFGLAHTRRVFDIARKNFNISLEIKDLVFSSIILHDVGGSNVEDQYKKGPEIANSLLRQLGCNKKLIQDVCEIIRTHHKHPKNPSQAFKILYDSDRLVMFSPEEFFHYNSKPNFNWKNIFDLIYHKHIKYLAKKLLQQRRKKK